MNRLTNITLAALLLAPPANCEFPIIGKLRDDDFSIIGNRGSNRMNKLTSLALAALLLVLAAPHAVGARQGSDFDLKAAKLFTKTYSFHTWNETDHVVDGEDWSLPPWVKPAPYSGVQIRPKLVSVEFSGRIQRGIHASWRETEPTEGTFDFSALRKEILQQSEGGKFAVKMGLGASVWETRYFQSLQDRTIRKTDTGTAPRWLKDHGIPLIEEPPNKSSPFQIVNMDIYHPEYHRRYLKLVEAIGRSGIPQMKELDLCYLHLVSASRGEEGAGPPVGDPKRQLFEERLRAWADAFKGVAHKLCLVSGKEEDLELALKLGMGQRNGFVEHYMLHAPNPGLGQELDADGYLVVNEKCPLIAENRASGDENEEYANEVRFGPIETFPHRYHEAMLRALQMRRNFVWAEGGPWLVNPPLLHYMALELGKNARNAPDAWCYLRESVVKNGKQGQPVKNFERWLYQRDAGDARTEPAEKVEVPSQMFEFDRNHLHDWTARKTRTAIRFGVDENFLAGGPHAVAVKITYLDRGNAEWQFEYFTAANQTASRKVIGGDTAAVKTATFILKDAHFPGIGYTGQDLQIRALKGDAVIRLVRVIKLASQEVQEAAR